jgi:hypothetical protein
MSSSSIRVFWPKDDSDDSATLREVTTRLTTITGCSWFFTHHLRKKSQDGRTSLEDETLLWFQEACGSLSLVNHTDSRVGIEARTKGEADLVVAGFVRGLGKVGPFHVVREYDDDGEPQGYRLLHGVEHLNDHYRSAYHELPDILRFKDVKEKLGGKSSANAKAFLQQCQGLRLLQKLPNGLYQKVVRAQSAAA